MIVRTGLVVALIVAVAPSTSSAWDSVAPGEAVAAANACAGFRAKTIASYTYARSIKVTRTTCLDAEAVIRNFYSQEIGSSGATIALGYGCYYRRGAQVFCSKSEQRIRWQESSSPPPPAKTRKCGGITFTPRTEDGVFRIRAKRVGCRKARRVARASGNDLGPSGIDGTRFSYRRLGFKCRGVETAVALPMVRWRCTLGDATIRFTKA